MSRPLSPKGRSVKLMESQGFSVWDVERRIPHTAITVDLFGFADLFCIHRETGDLACVQSTSVSNVAARVRKITEHANLPLVRKAGISIFVHGWRKDKTARVIDIS